MHHLEYNKIWDIDIPFFLAKNIDVLKKKKLIYLRYGYFSYLECKTCRLLWSFTHSVCYSFVSWSALLTEQQV